MCYTSTFEPYNMWIKVCGTTHATVLFSSIYGPSLNWNWLFTGQRSGPWWWSWYLLHTVLRSIWFLPTRIQGQNLPSLYINMAKNIFRHCQVFHGDQNCPLFETSPMLKGWINCFKWGDFSIFLICNCYFTQYFFCGGVPYFIGKCRCCYADRWS